MRREKKRRTDEEEEGDKMAGNTKRKTKKLKIGNRSNEHSDHMQMTNSLIEMPIN